MQSNINITIKESPKYRRIHYRIDSKSSITLLCPLNLSDYDIRKYLEEHAEKFIEISNFSNTKDKQHHNNVQTKKTESILQKGHPKQDHKQQVLPNTSADFSLDKRYLFKLNLGYYLFDYEGYKVYVDVHKDSRGQNSEHIDASIIDETNISVKIPEIYSGQGVESFIRGYLFEYLDKLVHVQSKRHTRNEKISHKVVVNLHSFSYVNPRKDIDDEDFLKQSKHKLKGSVIAPVRTQKYVGELPKNIIGTVAIGPDGRVIEISRKIDIDLEDRNNK